MEDKRVNCRQCQHYFITWDRSFPYGCKAYGFKTREIPSLTVFRSSGKKCLMFIKK